MATITLTTTAAQDAAVQDFIVRFNAAQRRVNPGWVDLTPGQYVREYLNNRLDGLVRDYQGARSQTKAQLYSVATEADQLAIDTILAKYALG